MLDRIKAMRLREEDRGAPAACTTRPKRILFNCQFAWEFGYVEYALAAALRLRGHDVRMIICGGLPEYCEQETQHDQRPSCETCVYRMFRRLDAFGLPQVIMSDCLSWDDISFARQVSQEYDAQSLRDLREAGVPVGMLAFYNLFHYFHGYPFEITGEAESVFRRCISSGLLITRAAQRLCDQYQPDILCTVNGKFLQWAPFVHAARQRDIPYSTWEDLRVSSGAVTFASNAIAHEMPLDNVWAAQQAAPFSQQDRARIQEHFRLWAAGSITPWPYYGQDVVVEPEKIRSCLGLRPDAPLVSLFPNVCWDSTSVGFESAFESMYDWIAQAVRYAGRRPDLDLVIRAHPAEIKLPPKYRSTTPVAEFVRRHCIPVPPNVKVLEGDSPISSYGLGSLSHVVMTYTSTLGIEFALAGLRPWVAARAHYGRKGFTLDLQSARHMCDLLDGNTFDNRLTPQQVERAHRLAYLFRFRKIFSFPHLDDSGNFTPPSWRFFAPGGNAVLDDLCDAMLNQGDFIDVGARPGRFAKAGVG
jgi:hypothetical protein